MHEIVSNKYKVNIFLFTILHGVRDEMWLENKTQLNININTTSSWKNHIIPKQTTRASLVFTSNYVVFYLEAMSIKKNLFSKNKKIISNIIASLFYV